MALTEDKAVQQKGRTHSSLRRHPEGCFAVEVADNANAPELRPGDIVVVDPQTELAPGDFVYIEIRNHKTRPRTFRRYREYMHGEIRLVPLNKNYRAYRFGEPSEPTIAILGKVIELSRSFSMPAADGVAAKAC